MNTLLATAEQKALSAANAAYANLSTYAKAEFHKAVLAEMSFARAHPLIYGGIMFVAGIAAAALAVHLVG